MPGKAETLFTERNDARKGEKAFPERKSGSQRRSSIAKSKTLLPSENNVCNGENASIERKHHNRAKTGKMCLLSDISARKTRFRIFRSVDGFSHVRATFSFGKSVPKTRICSINAFLRLRFRSGNALSNLGGFSAGFFVGKAVIVFANPVFAR